MIAVVSGKGGVGKTGKMAVEAHLKLVGVVENMSHAVCPDCGKETRIFGGDGGDRVAG